MSGSQDNSNSKRNKSPIRGIREVNGRWQYRFMLQGTVVELVTDLRATARNLATAVKLKEQHRDRLLRGDIVQARLIPFSEAAERFVAWAKREHAAKANTWKRQRTSLASMRAFFSGRAVRSIRPGDFESYKTWRRENGIREVTIRHDIHAASQLLQFARKHGWIEHDPLAGVAIPSDKDSRNEYVLTDAEEKLYLASAADHHSLYDLAVLMLQQGLRPEEGLTLKPADIDLAARTLGVRDGKSAAARRKLHLTMESCRILGRRLALGSEWIFPSRRHVWHRRRREFYWVTSPDKRLTYSGLVNAHNQALEKSDLSFTIYTLRHTFATRLYESTRDIVIVARILGHADLKSVMRYVHIRDDRAREAMLLFEQRQSERGEEKVQ